MHVFDYSRLADSVDAELLNVTNAIFDLRSRNDLRQQQDKLTFDRLKEAATIESVRGSNAVEGIVTTRARLAELVQGAEPRAHGEREIFGHLLRGWTDDLARTSCSPIYKTGTPT